MPRPKVDSEVAKRHPLSVRTTLAMRQQIEAAAAKSGRSMMQEIEHRLENSFSRDVVFEMLLGGSENSRFFEKLATIIHDAGRDWAMHQPQEDELVQKLVEAVRHEGMARRFK